MFDTVKPPRRRRRHLRDAEFGLIATIPALLVLSVVVVWPILTVLQMSFQDESLYTPRDERGVFIGLDNYVAALSDPNFIASLGRLVVFVGASVIGQFLLGFVLALALNQRLRGRGFLRGLFLVPWIIPSAAATLLWLYLFNPQLGMVNHILEALGLIEQNAVWLQHPDRAMLSLIITSVWRGFPFHFLIALAALQNVPAEQMEAATMDGAGVVRRFVHVTLPAIRGVIALALVISMVWQTQNFVLIKVLTQGGPGNATTIASYYLYQEAFERFEFGTASAMAIVLMILLIGVAVLILMLVRGRKDDDR